LSYLRTREVRFKGVVSEVRVSSDKGKQDHRCSVRSWSIFRQEKANSKGLCPKLEYLQTGEGEIKGVMSKVEVSSDRGRRAQRRSVRSWSIFRQGKAKSKELCPKLRYLQTGEGEIKGVVSEVELSSDKGSRNQRSSVRS